MKDVNNPFGIGKKIEGNNFIGNAYLLSLANADWDENFSVSTVTFEAKARNNWHRHPHGQILIATDGIGYYQEENKAVVILKKGDVIKCQPNVKHWHGASHNSSFSHLVVMYAPSNEAVVWMEPVTNEYYNEVSK